MGHLVASAEKTGQQILLAFLPASLFSSGAQGGEERGLATRPSRRQGRASTSPGNNSGADGGPWRRERKEQLLILRERVFVSPGETRNRGSAVQAREAPPSLGRLAKKVKAQDALSCLVKIFEVHMDVLLGFSSLLSWHSDLISLHLQSLSPPAQAASASPAFVSSPSSLFSPQAVAGEAAPGDSGAVPATSRGEVDAAKGEACVRTTLEVAADSAAQARAENGQAAVAGRLHFVSLLFHVYHSLQAHRRRIWTALQDQVLDVLAHLTLADAHSCPAVNDVVSVIHGVYAYVISGCRLCCVSDKAQEGRVEKMEREALDLLARVSRTDGRVSSHLKSWIRKEAAGLEAARDGARGDGRAEEGRREAPRSLLPSRSPVIEELYRQVLRLLDALEREELRSLLHLLEEENWQRLPVPRTFSFFAFGRQVPPAVPFEVYSHPNPALFHACTFRVHSSATVRESDATVPPFFRQPFPPRLPPFPYAREAEELAAEKGGGQPRSSGTAALAPFQENGEPLVSRTGLGRDTSESSALGLLPEKNCFRGWCLGRPLPGVPHCLYSDEVAALTSDGGCRAGSLQSPVVSLTAKLTAKEMRQFFRLAYAFPLATFPSTCAVLDQVGFYIVVAAGVSLASGTFSSLLASPVSPSLASLAGDSGDAQMRRKFLEATDAAVLQSRSPALRALLLRQEARVRLLFDATKSPAGSRVREAVSADAARRRPSCLSQGDASGGVSGGSGACGFDQDSEEEDDRAGNRGGCLGAASQSVNLAHILRPMAKQSSPGALWGAAERTTAVDSAAAMAADLRQQLCVALAPNPNPGWLGERLTREQQRQVRGDLEKLQEAADELRSVAFLDLAGCLCDSPAFICSLLRAVSCDFSQTPEKEPSASLGLASYHASMGGVFAPRPSSQSTGPGGASCASVERALESQRGLLRDLTRRLRCAGGGAIALTTQRDLWRAIEVRSILDCVEVLSAAPLPPAPAVQSLSPDPLLCLADSLRGFLRDVHALVLTSSEAAADGSRSARASGANAFTEARASPAAPSSSLGGSVSTGRTGPCPRAAPTAGGTCAERRGEGDDGAKHRCFFGGVDLAFLDSFTEAIAMSAADVLQWCRYQQKRTAQVSPAGGEAPMAANGAGRETVPGAAGDRADRRAAGARQRGREAVYSLRVLSNAVLRMEGFGFLPRGKASDLERQYMSLLAENEQKRTPQQSQATSPVSAESVRLVPPPVEETPKDDAERAEDGNSGREARRGDFGSKINSVSVSAASGRTKPVNVQGNQAAMEPRQSAAWQQAAAAVDRHPNSPSPEELNRYLKQLDHHRRLRTRGQDQSGV